MARKTDIFDRQFLSNLQRLSIAVKRPFKGALKGEKRSPKRGTSIEFADYREYVPGDDFRYIDWVLYGRLDRLYLRLFEEEEDLFLYILLDESLSMSFGQPSKFETGQRLAAALAYIALTSLNRVQVCTFSHRLTHRFGPKRGKSSIYPLFDFLAAREPMGPSDLGRSLREFNVTTRRKGVLVVISDFLFQEGYKDALAPIVGRGSTLVASRVMVRPRWTRNEGDLLLLDSETGEQREVTMSPAAVRRYRERVSAHNADLRDWCFRHRANYTLVTTDMDFRDVVMRYLRLQGFLT